MRYTGGTTAVDYAGNVLAHLDPYGDGGACPRRAASARLDLALALLSAGRPDEAAEHTLDAIESGRIVPSNTWRVAEIVNGVETAGTAAAPHLREAYEAMRTG